MPALQHAETSEELTRWLGFQGQLNRARPERIFLWIAPLLYAAFALLTPPFQTPDEHQHLFRAWQLSNLELIGERRGNEAGGFLPSGLGRAAQAELGSVQPHAERTVEPRSIAIALARATPIETGEKPVFLNFFGSVIYSPAGYVPQILAIWVGRALGLPVDAILLLGRLLNAALAIGLIYLSMRLLPLGRAAFLWVGLFPMTAASSAAFGQDALVIGGGCLLTAAGLRVALRGSWSRSEFALVAAVGLSVTLAKMVYLPLAAIAALPVPRGRNGLKWILRPALICTAAAAMLLLWLTAVSPLIVDWRPGEGRLANVSDITADPIGFVAVLARTFTDVALFRSLFTFGWLNVGPVGAAATLSLIALAGLLLAGDAKVPSLRASQRLWLLLLATSCALLIALGLYLSFTLAGSAKIVGIQGRYFLPLAPAALIAFMRPPSAGRGWLVGAVGLLMLCANIAVLHAIARAYYLF